MVNKPFNKTLFLKVGGIGEVGPLDSHVFLVLLMVKKGQNSWDRKNLQYKTNLFMASQPTPP